MCPNITNSSTQGTITMTINPHDRLPTIPDTMPGYTEAEKALARQKQAEAKKQAEAERSKSRMSRGKKLGLWAAGGFLIGTPATVGLAVALHSGGDSPEQQPGVTGSEKVGDDIGGVSLNKDQLASYTSGNPEERNEVLDEVLLPATEKALNDPSKLSILSTDPAVLDKLKGLTEDAYTRAGASKEGEVYITVAPTELDDTNDEAFNNEPSVLNEGEDVILPVKIDSVVNGEVKVRYTLEGITVTLNGNHLAFTSNQ
jgi:hypothetical protein